MADRAMASGLVLVAVPSRIVLATPGAEDCSNAVPMSVSSDRGGAGDGVGAAGGEVVAADARLRVGAVAADEHVGVAVTGCGADLAGAGDPSRGRQVGCPRRGTGGLDRGVLGCV